MAEEIQRAVTVADDEDLVLDMLVSAVRSWGFEARPAKSGQAVIHLFEQRPTPVLITDLSMPGRDGLWLVKQLKTRWPDVAIIILTGRQDADAAIECLNAGASRYFLKPVDLRELRHSLYQVYESYSLRVQNRDYQSELESKVLRQTARLRRTFLSVTNSLTITLEARDSYTAGHSQRVRQIAIDLGKRVGLDGRILRRLDLAAQLHDIGKVGTPESILNKTSSLTREEFDVIKQHTVVGERILAPIIRSRAILGAIRNHHERYDGGGYPDGLAAEAIPLLARVISIADAFDAMVSSRAYRPALSRASALEKILHGRGTQFDPDLADTFLDAIGFRAITTCV